MRAQLIAEHRLASEQEQSQSEGTKVHWAAQSLILRNWIATVLLRKVLEQLALRERIVGLYHPYTWSVRTTVTVLHEDP